MDFIVKSIPVLKRDALQKNQDTTILIIALLINVWQVCVVTGELMAVNIARNTLVSCLDARNKNSLTIIAILTHRNFLGNLL